MRLFYTFDIDITITRGQNKGRMVVLVVALNCCALNNCQLKGMELNTALTEPLMSRQLVFGASTFSSVTTLFIAYRITVIQPLKLVEVDVLTN
jgi:hypothetical protein